MKSLVLQRPPGSAVSRETARGRTPRRAEFIWVIATVFAMGCYINAKLPLDRDLQRTRLGSKEGRASAQSVLWVVAWGDAGIQAAARQGGLRVVQHADQEVFMLLGGVYTRLTTVVYGD